MDKIDRKRDLADLYKAPRKPVMVDVPPLMYMMVDGRGDPNVSQWFKEAVGALYAVSYTLKFKLKKGPLALDYVVMPLQGLWWAEDMDVFLAEAKDEYEWTLMILQPDEVTEEMFTDAVTEVKEKKGLAAVDGLRLENYQEGPSAQVMHIGPYADEAPTIASLHEFIDDSGHEPRGKHHEIYLGDPQRTAPERLRTIIRQPIG